MVGKSRFRVCRSKLGVVTCVGLLIVGGCVPAMVTAALILRGYYYGRLAVDFQRGAGSARTLGEAPGEVRLNYGTEGGAARLRGFEGILPGFLPGEGTTQATLDMITGGVSGTVYPPEGDPIDLNSLMPGVRVTRVDPLFSKLAGEAKLAWKAKRGPAPKEIVETVFQIEWDDDQQGFTYVYEVVMIVEVDDATGDRVSAVVTVRRSVSQNGVLIFNETGTGNLQANKQSLPAGGQPLPLPPPPRPVICDAGPDRTIAPSESVVLEAGVRGGVDWLDYSWTPVGSLDDPTILRPTASPSSTQ